MKGMVFTEFLDMVEDKFSADMVDDIIDDADLPSGGVYTAVGSYPHEEIVALVVALSQRSGVAVPDLLQVYGSHLFTRFAQGYGSFFTGVTDALDFLAGIENIIHAEVLKLYPDAQLPHFDVERSSPDELIMIYDSSRHFEDLAEGLIKGCIAHFGGGITYVRTPMGQGDARKTRFHLTRA